MLTTKRFTLLFEFDDTATTTHEIAEQLGYALQSMFPADVAAVQVRGVAKFADTQLHGRYGRQHLIRIRFDDEATR